MNKGLWLIAFVLGIAMGYGLARFFNSPDPDYQVNRDFDSHPEPYQGIVSEQPPIVPVSPRGAVLQTQEKEVPGREANLLQLYELAATHQWVEVIRQGEALWNRREGARSDLSPILNQAYSILAQAALDQGDPAEARRLLSQAAATLGNSAGRLLLQAELYQGQGDFQQAIANLHQALALEPLLADQIFPLIRQSMAVLIEDKRGMLTPQEKMRMLGEEIINDPGHAPYHAMLGKLQFDQGQYQESVSNLGYAIQLDGMLSSHLTPLIKDAQRRLSSPDLVEVPISTKGETLFVAVGLNGLEQRFRFVLDTGATFTAITQPLAHLLGLDIAKDQPIVELATARGVIKAPLTTLQSVEIDGIGRDNVQAIVLPELEGADGLLGMSFLRYFDVDINHTGQKLVLIRRH